MKRDLAVASCNSGAGGYTLFEAIVTILILGILSGLAVPAFVGLRDRQQLGIARDKILQQMRRAKQEARRRQERVQFSLATATVGGEEFLVTAVHPVRADASDSSPNAASECMPSDSSVFYETLVSAAIVRVSDANTTLGPSSLCSGERARIQFDGRGGVRDVVSGAKLGRITLVLANDETVKRCAYVSTILGAMRTAQDGDCG